MATKLTDTCLQKAADDEPIFVLRAQDMLAPQVVRFWADLVAVRAGAYSAELPPKVVEARALADRMEQWPTRKYPD